MRCTLRLRAVDEIFSSHSTIIFDQHYWWNVTYILTCNLIYSQSVQKLYSLRFIFDMVISSKNKPATPSSKVIYFFVHLLCRDLVFHILPAKKFLLLKLRQHLLRQQVVRCWQSNNIRLPLLVILRLILTFVPSLSFKILLANRSISCQFSTNAYIFPTRSYGVGPQICPPLIFKCVLLHPSFHC